MEEQKRCPRCGSALPAGGAAGGCRRCLFALGLTLEGAEPSPARVAAFHILDVVSAGESGTLYIAEREAGGRVALRVLGPRPDAHEVLARFAAARGRLARVRHPGVVVPFDAGVSEEGSAWFASEWTAGVPITEHCDRERLAVRERLELLVQVCAAMEDAHAHGLVHENLEPAKVLVAAGEGGPAARVIDFGLARALGRRPGEHLLLSARGLLGRTLGYLSPEQLETDGPPVDAATDVHALGVLLYELLVGQMPFEARRLRRARWAEVVRIIQQETPPRPSARVAGLAAVEATEAAAQRRTEPRRLVGSLRGDLDWIVQKALARRPSDRYPSAGSLGRDVQRHLRGEPVAPGLRSLGRRLRRALLP